MSEQKKKYNVEIIDIYTQLQYMKQILLPVARYFDNKNNRTEIEFKHYADEIDQLPVIVVNYINETIEMVEEMEEQEIEKKYKNIQ